MLGMSEPMLDADKKNGRKAYLVRGFDGISVLIFSTSDVAAKKRGADELNGSFEDIESCVRKPEFDAFSKQGWVPAEVLIEHDWTVECGNCYMAVNSDLESPDGDELCPVFEGSEVWCSQGCKDDFHLSRRRREATMRALPRYLRRRWPEAEFVSGSASQWTDRTDRNAIVWFRFPGSIGRAELTVRATKTCIANGRRIGHVFVERRDLKAWYDFVGTPELYTGAEVVRLS